VLAWSRYRFVRFANDETGETTLALMAECFEELGGVPAVALTDRMACLKNGVVANVVVPHPDYVRFAAHYGAAIAKPSSGAWRSTAVSTARRK
jgi:transposase